MLNSVRSYPVNPFNITTTPLFRSSAFGPAKYSSRTASTRSAEEGIVRETALGFPLLSEKTIFTPMKAGVGVIVAVGVCEGVNVGVRLGVNVGVTVDV